MSLLEVKNLHVEIDGKKILNGLDLTVEKGEVHAIMGPNGSGKSTLSYVLAGKADYEVTEGEILFDGEKHRRHGAGRARGQGLVPGLPVSDRNSRRRHHDVPAHRGERAAQGARRSGIVDAGIHEEGARGRRQARDRPGNAAARGQCRLFRRREEAQRDPADGDAGAAPCGAGRDRFRPRHRRAEDRGRRRQPAALAGALVRGHHALPAAARLHRAGHRACAVEGPHRAHRRQGAGAGARGKGLRAICRKRRRKAFATWPN